MTINEWDNMDDHYTIFCYDAEESFDVLSILTNLCMGENSDLTTVYRLNEDDVHSKIVICFFDSDDRDYTKRLFFNALSNYNDGRDVAAIYEESFEDGSLTPDA